MSLPEGTPGSRTTYQIEITAREKEACERLQTGVRAIGDWQLAAGVLKKIVLLPKKDLAGSKSEE